VTSSFNYDAEIGGMFIEQRPNLGSVPKPLTPDDALAASAHATVPDDGGGSMTQTLDPDTQQLASDAETITCSSCDKQNEAGSAFCAQCGTKLEADAASEPLAGDDDEDLGGKPNPGTPADKRLKKNKSKTASTPNSAGGSETFADDNTTSDGIDPASLAVMQQTPEWRGVLVVEGMPTGDGREFADDSLQWATPPLPLRWQKVDSHGGMPTNETVNVGTIQKVWRAADGKIWGEGVWDHGSDNADAAAAMRRNNDGSLSGISIDADDITDADIEYVFPESDGESEEEGDLFMLLFATPEKIIFHSARIRAATLCDIPAFVEAQIHAIPDDEREALAASALVLDDLSNAVHPHATATSDGTWDGSASEARLTEQLQLEIARELYAWVDDSQVTDDALSKTACQFLHHEVNADGTPGPANLTACSAGIGVLNGSRGGADIDDVDKRGVYEHLAKHLRDANQEPPPFEPPAADAADVLLAGAAYNWRPQREWFENPNLGQVMPIMVTEAGRIYGHAAQWGTCHLGFMNECVMPPFEDHHDHFLTGEVICDDGSRVAVGQITAGLEHAPLSYGASRAKQQYENTDACVADIVTGNDKHGIWVAGAVRPWAHESRVHALRASGQVSPDWRRIGGALRMVALLTVNTSGYQVARARSFVAGGQIQSLVSSGMIAVQGPRVTQPTEDELNKRAMKLMRDQLAKRVHG
jgi:hypothetical protein